MHQKTLSIKEASHPSLLMCWLKQIFRRALTILLLLAFLWGGTSFAESLGDSVPKGDEVKDPNLEKLFAPEFQFVTQLYYHGPELKEFIKSSQVPANGLILSIEIDKGDESISDNSFIKIHYSIDPAGNKRTIEMMNTQYKTSAE